MLVLILSCVCVHLLFLCSIRVFVYSMPFSVNTGKNRAVFSVLVDYSSAIYFVHAVKKLEGVAQ